MTHSTDSTIFGLLVFDATTPHLDLLDESHARRWLARGRFVRELPKMLGRLSHELAGPILESVE